MADKIETEELQEVEDLVIVVIDYITAPSLKELKKKVLSKIDKGWTPLEVPVVIDLGAPAEERYIQTIVLEDYDE